LKKIVLLDTTLEKIFILKKILHIYLKLRDTKMEPSIRGNSLKLFIFLLLVKLIDSQSVTYSTTTVAVRASRGWPIPYYAVCVANPFASSSDPCTIMVAATSPAYDSFRFAVLEQATGDWVSWMPAPYVVNAARLTSVCTNDYVGIWGQGTIFAATNNGLMWYTRDSWNPYCYDGNVPYSGRVIDIKLDKTGTWGGVLFGLTDRGEIFVVRDYGCNQVELVTVLPSKHIYTGFLVVPMDDSFSSNLWGIIVSVREFSGIYVVRLATASADPTHQTNSF